MARLSWCAVALLAGSALASAAAPVRAQDTATSGSSDVFADWEHRASAIQAEQPHWVTPLVTVTPRLEQELRYDLAWRTAPNGTVSTSYGVGKGLELIPFDPVELIIGVPPYTAHHSKTPDGWGDWPLLLKLRLLAANETHGNYIITAFVGGSVPTGGKANGTGFGSVTPTLAGGKGWGDFDVQATAAVNIPTGGESVLGHSLQYNAALQYRIERFLWPEVELNGTSWRDGEHLGENQIFITPGVVLGRFPLHALYNRLGLTIGAGVQVAATHYRQYDHGWTVSMRMPF